MSAARAASSAVTPKETCSDSYYKGPKQGFLSYPQEWRKLRRLKFSGDAQHCFMIELGWATWSAATDEHGERRTKKNALPPPEWTAPMTVDDWARLLVIDAATAEWVIADAVKRGLVERRKVTGRKGHSYRTNPAMWQNAKDYQPKSQAPKEERKAEKVPNALGSQPVILMPGDKSRPIPLSVAVHQVRPLNETNFPVEFFAMADDNGYLSIRIRELQEGEGKKRANPNALGFRQKHVVENTAPSSFWSELKRLFSLVGLEAQYHTRGAEVGRNILHKLGTRPPDEFLRFVELRKIPEKLAQRKPFTFKPGISEEFVDDFPNYLIEKATLEDRSRLTQLPLSSWTPEEIEWVREQLQSGELSENERQAYSTFLEHRGAQSA